MTAYTNHKNDLDLTGDFVHYLYDQLSRQDSYTDSTGMTQFTYDPNTQQVASVTSPEGVINYEYDPATGQHTRTYTASTETRYHYDELGRLDTVTAYKLGGQDYSSAPLVTTYTYTAVGTLGSEKLPNGVEQDYSYDSLNRLTKETIEKVAGSLTTLLETFKYGLQSDGSRTSALEVTYDDTGTVNSADLLQWSYDALDRLTNETRSSVDISTLNNTTPTTTGTEYSDTYTMDLVGNRMSKTHDDADNTKDETITSSYNTRDQLTQEISTLHGTTTYTYDANGSTITVQNTTTGQHVIYGYDLRNRMVTADTNGDGSVVTTYLYDDAGNRVAEITASGGTTTYTYDLVDDYNPTGYSQVLEESATQGGTPSRAYEVGNDIIAQVRNAAIEYLLKDGHGNTRMLVDAAVTILQRYTFDAFGNAVGFDAASAMTKQLLADGRFDLQTGLTYQRARYRLDGRFMSADSYMGTNEDPLSLHKYVYGNGDPINRFDPSGNISLIEQITVEAIKATLYAWVGVASLNTLRTLGAKAVSKTDLEPSGRWWFTNAGLSVSGLGIGVSGVSSVAHGESSGIEITGLMYAVSISLPTGVGVLKWLESISESFGPLPSFKDPAQEVEEILRRLKAGAKSAGGNITDNAGITIGLSVGGGMEFCAPRAGDIVGINLGLSGSFSIGAGATGYSVGPYGEGSRSWSWHNRAFNPKGAIYVGAGASVGLNFGSTSTGTDASFTVSLFLPYNMPDWTFSEDI